MKYTRKEARLFLKGQLQDYCNRITTKKGNQYVCPLCNSGQKKNGTPAFSIDRNRKYEYWKCFSCNETGDIFDLVAKVENLQSFNEAFDFLCNFYSIEVEDPRVIKEEAREKLNDKPEEKTENEALEEFITAGLPISEFCSEFFNEMHKNNDYSYLEGRGISREVQDRFKIGFNPEQYSQSKGENIPAIIIPVDYDEEGNEYYSFRGTEEKIYEKRGKAKIFNEYAIHLQKPLFVVEGEIDALSIIEAGGNAIALGGVSNYEYAYSVISSRRGVKNKEVPIILALDNDKAGRKAEENLYIKLFGGGHNCIRLNLYGACKDANECLVNDREGFIKTIKEIIEDPEEYYRKQRAEEYKERNAQALLEIVQSFDNEEETTVMSTGFFKLDHYLNGGLHEGLICIGAGSSMGKTTFVLQLCDNIAKQGLYDVLFLSLEMGRKELIAKSLSRLTYTIAEEKDIDINNCKTVTGILDSYHRSCYNLQEKDLVARAINEYAEYQGNIYIEEYDITKKLTKETIRNMVINHIDITGRKPLLVIDYLQLIGLLGDKTEYKGLTDKQVMDIVVLSLKQISRELHIPVLVISSLNREATRSSRGYVGMESFKESGIIEYSSDVLISIQFTEAFNEGFDFYKEREQNPRKVSLGILKNRNGAIKKRIDYTYYPLFNYFKEDIEEIII